MIQMLDALLAFIQHYSDLTVIVCGTWVLVAFFALCAFAEAHKRLNRKDGDD